MDICSPKGFVLSLYSMLTTKRGGSTTLAPVCSTWVYMNLDSWFVLRFVWYHLPQQFQCWNYNCSLFPATAFFSRIYFQKKIKMCSKMFPIPRPFRLPWGHHLRCKGTTQRTKACPLGTEIGATQVGNIMAARLAILLLVAGARGIHWLLEQPKGSMFQYHPQIEVAFNLLRCWRKHIKMGSFGAATEKPTWLYSSWGLRIFLPL